MIYITKYWKWLAVGLGVWLTYKFIDKHNLIDVINQSLPAEEAGVIRGILLGDKGGMDRQLTQDFKKSGLIHLMVASGSNITLLSRGIIEAGAKWLGRKTAIATGLVLIWGYAAMVGWEPPIVRALLLITVYYWAQWWGRKFNLARGLGLAIAMMAAAQPTLMSDLSFWLSLTAFVGLVSFRAKNSSNMVQTAALAGWISLWTWPVLALSIGEVSWVSPVSNAAVMLVTETISLTGTAGVGLGLVWPEAGRWILWLTLPLVKYLIWVGRVWGGMSTLTVRFNIVLAGGWYLILGYWAVRLKKRQR